MRRTRMEMLLCLASCNINKNPCAHNNMVNTNVKYVITIVVSENTEFKTTNGKEMSDKLNRLTVHGGGDCPEYAFTGLKTGWFIRK